MSDETTQKGLNCPAPTRVEQTQRYIGQVNYFRDHVYTNRSELARPRRVYLFQNKSNRTKLLEPAKIVFFEHKNIISLQTKLYF